MLAESIRRRLETTLKEIRDQGLWKEERVIDSPQGAKIQVGGREVLNFCANNYLGLASHPEVIEAARRALDRWGYGMASVRFICGTQGVHKELERQISGFLETEETILYSSCFDANGGVFEPLAAEDCAIVTDQLNHASIIDGVRLTKARRLIYRHADLGDLEAKLKEADGAAVKIVATDGVFSMDGDLAPLGGICDLAEHYGALVLVDDSHATGFVGRTGRGTAEHFGVLGRIDAITTTFGKALGGATGGCVSGRREIVELLRQRSRPYLFSNSLAPAMAAATLAALRLLARSTELRDRLEQNARWFRARASEAGFEVRPGFHPIVPIMLYDERRAVEMARDLLAEGIYVIGFSYPVVPKGLARIRVQLSALHTPDDLQKAVDAFRRVGKRLGVVR